MNGYYIKETEPGLFTVGCNDSKGNWHPFSDHESHDEAEKKVHFLNGGTCNEPETKQPVCNSVSLRDFFAGCALAGIIRADRFEADTMRERVELAFIYADAMLKAREA